MITYFVRQYFNWMNSNNICYNTFFHQWNQSFFFVTIVHKMLSFAVILLFITSWCRHLFLDSIVKIDSEQIQTIFRYKKGKIVNENFWFDFFFFFFSINKKKSENKNEHRWLFWISECVLYLIYIFWAVTWVINRMQ